MHKTKARFWTDDEYQTLEELAGIYPLDTIAKKMGRSKASVKRYAQRKGISLITTVDNFTMGQVAKILDVCPTTVWYWIKRKKLKDRKMVGSNTRRISCNSLKQFYQRYPHLRLWRNVSQDELDWLFGE